MRVAKLCLLCSSLIAVESEIVHNAESNGEKKNKRGNDNTDQSRGTDHLVRSNEAERALSTDAE